MTEFAGCFLRVKKVSFCCGSVSVVAHAASLEHAGIEKASGRRLFELRD
jgi:hypothetical protein